MTRTAVFVVLLALGLMAAPAFAVVTIDFGTGSAGMGGTYTYLGGNNGTGTNVPIGSVTITGAPTNDGVFNVTGTCTGTGAGGPFGCLNFNTTTGAISIVGGIPTLGIANGTTLLTGTLTSWTADGNGLHDAVGPDTKAASLLTALGLATNTQFNFLGFSLDTNTVAVNQSTSVISTDVRNTSAVPEPSSIMLFGTALLGSCAALRRRRVSKS